ncbi:MAG: DNA alkylation repair protein, partial [Gemmatimonadaceae bacterium]
LASLSDATIARQSQRFFKTGKGDYAEGDRFRGIRVPVLRRVAQSCAGMPLGETLRLLRSRYHEDRLVALIVMVQARAAGDQAAQQRIARAYLGNLEYVNNWDLVDSSAPYILGAHLLHRSRSRLYRLARSRSVWERRVAIIATAQFIRHGEAAETLRIAAMLLADEHDLIHKAVGWMLREVGQRCDARLLRDFLDAHAARMPRTMLRYAIEHFAPNERQRYLKMKSGRMR